MMTIKKFGQALGVASILAISACASNTPSNGSQNSAQSRSPYSGYGTVDSINTVKQEYQGVGRTGLGLGTIAGAVIGGVVGHQVGSGRGNTAATVAGTAGGAYVGHQLETRNQAVDHYAITVRMDSGSYQTLTQATTDGLQIGDRVRIANGSMRRY